MADLSQEQLRRLARLGAQARLDELHAEEKAIRAAFPGLSTGRASGAATTARPKMSAASRKAVSLRMRKYWAQRRAAKAK